MQTQREAQPVAESGSEFRELKLEDWPQARRGTMPKPVSVAGVMSIARVLIAEFGLLRGAWWFTKASIWDYLFHKPRWYPERFHFETKEEERFFRELFDELKYFIVLFNSLRARHGEFLADEITGKMAIPFWLPYLRQCFRRVDSMADIDPLVQQMSDYLADYVGDDKGFAGQVFVAEDGSEVRFHVTKCAHIMILRAYRLSRFAAHTCLADHVVFDNDMPELVFGRAHTIGVGDGYCDHVFRVRTPQTVEREDSDYGDAHKIDGARTTLRHWAEVLRQR